MTTNTKKKTNPLYVVTNNGKDVEQAEGTFDLLVKKLGLEPAIKVLSNILELLLAQVESYATFVAIKEFLDQLIAQVEAVTKKMAPFLFYYKA